MTQIPMPQLSDSMTEGTILTWLKADGDSVAVGDELVEIETDKATMTYEAEAAGTLTILAPEGASLQVGEPMASVGDGATAAEPVLSRERDAPDAVAEPDAGGNGARPSAPSPAGDVKATPLARRFAEQHGVTLEAVSGSGPRGRITRGDVAATAGVAAPQPVSPARRDRPAPAPAPAGPTAKGETQVVELSRVQSLIAKRMAATKATVPDFQVQTDVAMDDAVAFRAQIKAAGLKAPSFNDLIVKAAALALRAHPRVNGSYQDGRFELYSRVNVGVAVAADDALVVPTIFDADTLALGAIAAETRRLAARVRDGSVSPAELSGATFTVSNLGMYGMTAITPVINAPQAAILGVGSMRAVPALVDEQLVERQLMTLTLSCDHRILYGADAAAFLSAIRKTLERPASLAL